MIRPLRFLLLLALPLLIAVPSHASLALKPQHAVPDAKWQGGNFQDTSFEGVRYISSQFLESLFGREGSWVPDRQKFVIPDSSGKKWFFTIDNPYMNIGDEVCNLVYPVRRGPEFLYLPLNPLVRLVNARGWS